MTQHLLVPGVKLIQGVAHPAYTDYLKEWRERVVSKADEGELAASLCLQATFIDLVLKGEPKHDWLSLMDEYLNDNGRPLAYSERFASRLFGFDSQYKQSTIHAIHTRWWLERLLNPENVDNERFVRLVLAKKQSDGLFYDKDVSETILRHRMKSELTMSAAMSIEILLASGALTEDSSRELATNLVDSRKCPTLGYMGMEFFRLQALRAIGYESLFPQGIGTHIEACSINLEHGWCDFTMTSKVDAYMGTAKRTQRDKPIHSPLTACHVITLVEQIGQEESRRAVRDRFVRYAEYLNEHPMHIPAFQMRDVPIPFGVDRTPIEVICGSFVISACPRN